MAIPAVVGGIDAVRVERVSLGADQNRPPLLSRAAGYLRHVRGQLILHEGIGGHHVAAKPDVRIPEAKQRIVIPRRRTQNKHVAARPAPQESYPLMAGVHRFHHWRPFPLALLPEMRR